MEDIVSLCKRRGFIFPGSDVYGGMAGTWDYGPLGVALKKKVMGEWWNYFVEGRDDIYDVDAAINASAPTKSPTFPKKLHQTNSALRTPNALTVVRKIGTTSNSST